MSMETLVDMFFHSLANYIKDELVSHELPSTLDEALTLAARTDWKVQNHRRERMRQNPPATSTWNDSTGLLSTSATPSSWPEFPERMEIGRASLTPAEHQCRLTSVSILGEMDMVLPPALFKTQAPWM